MGGLIGGALKALNLQGIVGILVGVILAALLGLQVHRTHLVQTQLTNTQASLVAVQGTVINYQQAAAKAQADAYANKQSVETKYETVVERTKADYEERLAAARATAQRLRDQASAAHPGSPDPARLPGPQGARPGAPEAAQPDGLSIDERLLATEQAIQLDSLIDYVEGVLKVGSAPDKGADPAKDSAGRR